MDQDALVAVVRADAERVARLLRSKAVDAKARRRARPVLMRAFAATDREDVEGDDETAAALDLVELLDAAADLQEARRELGDGALDATRPLKDVWIRTPMPDRVLPLVFVDRRTRFVAAVQERVDVNMAIDDERIAYFEARCDVKQPGMVKPIVERTDAEGERLLSSELELLRKRGRSRFS